MLCIYAQQLNSCFNSGNILYQHLIFCKKYYFPQPELQKYFEHFSYTTLLFTLHIYSYHIHDEVFLFVQNDISSLGYQAEVVSTRKTKTTPETSTHKARTLIEPYCPPSLISPCSYIFPLQHVQSQITTWHDKQFFAVILHAPKIINMDF